MGLRTASLALLTGGVGTAIAVAAAPVGPFEQEMGRQAARLEATAGRPEAIAPVATLAALDESVPAGVLEPLLRKASGPGADPLVAAQAAFQLARLLAQKGDAEGAAAARAPLGLFSHYWVVGPFGEGRSSLSETFPPESERGPPDPARRYAGKLRDVGWRIADGAVRDGVLFVDGLLRPDAQAAAYVLTYARSERAERAALRLGAPGPIKVWVNGTLVHTRDAVHAPALDQDAAAVQLHKGWNRILIKTVVTDGPWRLFLRVTDPAGKPLRVTDSTEAPKEGLGAGAAGKPKFTVRTLEGDLRRRAERAGRGSAAADAWLDLGRYLAWAEPGDRDAREAAAALETSIARRPSVEALMLLADVARDEDERRRALERALELGGARGSAEGSLALARLGEVARAQRRDAVALARWREALAADPGCWPAALALADEEQAAGLPLSALARVEALPPATRAVPRVRRALARLDEAAGRQRDADRLLEELARERTRDVELLHQLAARARATGDGKLAIARLEAAVALRPDLPSLAMELARVLEGAGQAERALAVLSDVAARLPDDVGTEVQLGKLLHRMGRRDEALGHLRTALLLRPQDPELRRYTDRLATPEANGEASGEELARRYAAAALPLVTSAVAAAARAGAAASGDATVLLDRRVVRVHKNGLSQTFAQRLVQIVTDHGAEDNKEFDVRYTPGSEEVEIRQARIYRPGPRGEVEILEATDRDDEDLSEPWYGLYYDNRAEVVRFEGLRAGDVLEIQYVVDDVASENQLADYFGDMQFIAEGNPVRRWDYTLIAPQSRPIYANAPRLPQLTHEVSEEGTDRVYRFAATDVPKIDAEPAMPGLAEVAPYLHVSTYASWAAVGAWYWHLVEQQLAPDDELRRAARGAVTPGMSERERVRAIHNLVVTETRYVGLEFGIHGFQPYKVTQVLARRFGDCKDKASLMVALLREVGIDSELVLVRTRRGGRIDSEPASLAVFDHAITYVPKLDVYLDGTAEFSGMAELPTQDQGVMVLRVGPRGSLLTETPVLPSSQNRVQRRWRVDMGAGGDAHVVEDLTIHGQAAPEWREHYQTSGERAERYGKVWTARYPGARLGSVDMPGIDDRNAPVTVRAVADVPHLGQPAQAGPAGLLLPVTVREADFARTYARLSSRNQDLVIAYPWQHDEELLFKLPEGWRLQGGPSTRELAGPFGRFHLEVAAAGEGTVRVRSFLDVTQFRIAPEDYGRFRAFLGAIDSALAERVAVAPAGAAP
jgi:tetratricopeptide (TPR) repeat protein